MRKLCPLKALLLLRFRTRIAVWRVAAVRLSTVGIRVDLGELMRVVIGEGLRHGLVFTENTALVSLEFAACIEVNKDGSTSTYFFDHILLRHAAVMAFSDVVNVFNISNDGAVGPTAATLR